MKTVMSVPRRTVASNPRSFLFEGLIHEYYVWPKRAYRAMAPERVRARWCQEFKEGFAEWEALYWSGRLSSARARSVVLVYQAGKHLLIRDVEVADPWYGFDWSPGGAVAALILKAAESRAWQQEGFSQLEMVL